MNKITGFALILRDVLEYNGCMERIHREFAYSSCRFVYVLKSVTRTIAITANTLAVSREALLQYSSLKAA